MAEASALQLLERHLDLLPSDKQSLARWLCEGGHTATRLPGRLRHRYANSVPSSAETPKRLLRELVLELLSQHRREIARRERLKSDRRTPLGPVLAWSRRP